MIHARQFRKTGDALVRPFLCRAARPLQNATAQIATLEDQVANLQAAEAPDVATIEALRTQLQNRSTAPSPKSAAGKAGNEAALAALRRQLAARTIAYAKSQSAYETASTAAGNAAAENAALQARLATANSGLASCRMKNTELFNLGNQILDAYSHKDDVFGAIADREPFTGLKRVQLENIVQNDQDKLYDNQLAPAGTTR